MKRKITLFLAVILAVGIMLTGCSGSYSKISVSGAKQDTSYAVLSNGGSAVQYGNYVYFINGYDGYVDDDGTANKWNQVEKGAIYRAELLGEKSTKKVTFFAADTTGDADPENKQRTPGYEEVTLNVFNADLSKEVPFVSTTERVIDDYDRDEDGNLLYDENEEKIPSIWHDVQVANVQLIAPKRAGTSGYTDGGIFIYDNYIFYASPNNKKNKEGVVQSGRTDFFRSKLDGSETVELYTTKNESASSEYMFYKQGGAYYLVVKDGTDIVSVKSTGKKVSKSAVIAEDVTAVHFPNKGIYYSGINENHVEDFIYYVRPLIDTDKIRQGDVLEAMRPNGYERFVISNDGAAATILGTNNGVFFYHTQNEGKNKIVKYTNLHEQLTDKKDGQGNKTYTSPSPSYNAKPGYQDNISGEFSDYPINDYTSVKCIYPDVRSIDNPYIIGFKSDGMSLISKIEIKQLTASTGTFVAIAGDMMYFYSSSLKRISLFSGAREELVTDKISASQTFKYDILDDFVVYLGDPDDYASDYRMFLNIFGNTEPVFVGKLIDADVKPEEDAEEDTATSSGCGSVVSSGMDFGGYALIAVILGGALVLTLKRKQRVRAAR